MKETGGWTINCPDFAGQCHSIREQLSVDHEVTAADYKCSHLSEKIRAILPG